MWCLKVLTGMIGVVIGTLTLVVSKVSGGLATVFGGRDRASMKVQKKLLKESERKGSTYEMDTSAAGVIIASGRATIATLYARPGASGEHMADQTVCIKSKGRIPEGILDNAEETVRSIMKIKPDVLRIAVDGLPGSTKGQLARAIAQKLGFAWECMEEMEANTSMNFHKPTSVYEHHRLLRTRNCDNFDAIVYVDEPVESAVERVMKRKGGTAILETWDFDRLKLVGDKAFEICSGESYNVPNTNIHIKIKPENGFGAEENITAELARHGIAVGGPDKEQMLFLCADRGAREGLSAYTHADGRNKESLLKLAEGMRNVQ